MITFQKIVITLLGMVSALYSHPSYMACIHHIKCPCRVLNRMYSNFKMQHFYICGTSVAIQNTDWTGVVNCLYTYCSVIYSVYFTSCKVKMEIRTQVTVHKHLLVKGH